MQQNETSKTTTRIGWILAMALSGAAAAQDVAQDPANPLLAKAKVMEEAEHDLAGAAELYAQVAADGDVGPAVRSDAFLRLAKVREKQGDLTGARAALESAAQGQGPAAEAARRELAAPQDPDRGQPAVDNEILGLIVEMKQFRGTGNAQIAREKLVWLGERAVPLLTEAVRTESDYEGVTQYAAALLRIGGPTVDAWIDRAARYDDALRRRAVIRGVDVVVRSSNLRVDLRSLAPFLADPSAEVRLQAVEDGVLIDWEQALRLLRDEDARVGDAALAWLGRNRVPGPELPPPERQRDVYERLLAEVDARAGADSSRAWSVLNRFPGVIGSMTDMSDRIAVTLRLVRVENLPSPNHSVFAGIGDSLTAPRAANALVPELLETARALRGGEPDGSNSRRVKLFGQARAAIVSTWNRASLAAAYELIELGAGIDVDWFGRNLQPADWVGLFERLESFEEVPGYSEDYLTRVLDDSIGVDLPAAAFEPLRKWFEANANNPGGGTMWLHRALVRLGKFGTEESVRWSQRMLTGGLAEFAVTGQNAEALRMSRDGLFEGMIAADSEATVEALRELAVVEGEGLAQLRNMALSRLAWLHDVESAPLFARAYELGLERTPMHVAWGAGSGGTYNLVGLGWIDRPYATSTLGQQPWPRTEPWTDAEQAKAIGPCLELGSAGPWEEAESMIAGAVPGGAVFEVAMRHWSRCPDLKRREAYFKNLSRVPAADDTLGLVRGLVIAALRDPAAEIRDEALGRIQSRSSRYSSLEWGDDLAQAVIACIEFDDEIVASRALSVLGDSGDPEFEALLVEYLGHDSRSLRLAAVRALYDLVPKRATDLTFETLKDPALRSWMCVIARQTLDRRFVPLLIDALRDRSVDTRAGAKEALDAIEFYVSQEQRWERLLGDAGLDAPSAAEALVRQARDAKDRKIRVTAIQSLGTLAVPETLPFLIQLMQDEDLAVRVAAEAAIQRINEK